MTQDILINESNVEIIDGDYIKSSDFIDIYNEGEMCNSTNEFIVLKSGENILEIDYELDVDFSIDESTGDYYTPATRDIDVNDFNITIKSFKFNDAKVDISKELNIFLQNLIKNKI